MLDITNETAILLDGKVIPIQLIRALGSTSSRLRIERDDASVEEVEVTREGDSFHYRRVSLSRVGNDQAPVEMEFRAEMVGPSTGTGAGTGNGTVPRRWVTRGDLEHINLLADGWEERGRTRPRTVPSQASIEAQVQERQRQRPR